MRVLAISGSLRAESSNTRLLRSAAALAPEIALADIVLPLFSPDLDVEPLPAPVLALRAAVGHADAIVISTPEYAHGIPGGLKNALDWLVSALEPIGKPVALWNASPGRGEYAQAQLIEVLTTMSLRVVHDAFLAAPVLDADLVQRSLRALAASGEA